MPVDNARVRLLRAFGAEFELGAMPGLVSQTTVCNVLRVLKGVIVVANMVFLRWISGPGCTLTTHLTGER